MSLVTSTQEIKYDLLSPRFGCDQQVEPEEPCCCGKKRDLLAPLRNFDEELSLLEIKKDPLKESLYSGCTYAKIKAAFDQIKSRYHLLQRNEGRKWGYRLLIIRRDNLLSLFSYTRSTGNQNREKELLKELEQVNSQILSNVKNSECCHLLLKVARKVEAVAARQLLQVERKKQHFVLEADKKWLEDALLFWKATHYPALPQQFSEEEIRRVDECCAYRGLISRLQEDPQYCRDFFESAFRNLLPIKDAVSFIVEFPALYERFHSTFIEKRLVRLGLSDALAFGENSEGNWVEKDVLLKIDGKFYSLRNETQEITFRTQKKSSLKEILTSFARRNITVGEFEFGPLGIVYFSPKAPPVLFDEKEWWKSLAPFQTLSRQQTEARYGVHLVEGQGVISIRASRQNPNGYYFDGSHAWFETAVPTGDGTFQIIPIGKYPDVEPFPTGSCETLFYTYSTKRAYLNYPDKNSFFNHREQVGVAHIADKQQLERWLDKIREDLLSAKRDELIFQAQGDNCAVWVQDVLDHVYGKGVLPRYFDVDVYSVMAPKPLNLVTYFYSFLANKVSRTFANVLRFAQGSLCGVWRGYKHFDPKVNKVVTSRLALNPRWYSGRIMLPCVLFHTAEGRAMPS
jgi:hypothetical protein